MCNPMSNTLVKMLFQFPKIFFLRKKKVPKNLAERSYQDMKKLLYFRILILIRNFEALTI
jgi:hypothetical protein